MSVQNCKNCGTCTCTGIQLTRAKDGRECCSLCVKRLNQEIDFYLHTHPGVTIFDLKQKVRKR